MNAPLGGLLTKKATFLIGLETSLGVNPGLTSADAIEVESPEYTNTPTVLQRNYAANDLSPFADIIGKIISGFKITTEVKSNGKAQSGSVADLPLLGRMISACGYKVYGMDATGASTTMGNKGTHGPAIPDSGNPTTSPIVHWASQTDATSNQCPVLYTIECTTGGASGAAEFTVTSNIEAEDAGMGDYISAPAATAAIMSGTTKVLLGENGGSVIPTWTGELTVGQIWRIVCFPKGIRLEPVSEAFPTASIEMNRDGLKFEGNAALGTFTVDATAGAIAKATFTYTTTYNDPTDEIIPDVDFTDELLPSQVELSQLTWGSNRDLLVEKWTFDQKNSIQVRASVNAKQGYLGSRISARDPAYGINPEATHEADQPFWDDFAKAKGKSFLSRIGTEVGNQVIFYGGKTQSADIKFADRNGTMIYDMTMAAKRIHGNDETIIVFA